MKKTRTVIRRECRRNTSLSDLLMELLGDPKRSLYLEAKPGLEQEVLLFRIHQLAAKISVDLHTRLTPAGVWVHFPYAKFEAPALLQGVQIQDEVQIAILGIEGEKQFCLMARTRNAGVEELEAVEVSLRESEDISDPQTESSY